MSNRTQAEADAAEQAAFARGDAEETQRAIAALTAAVAALTAEVRELRDRLSAEDTVPAPYMMKGPYPPAHEMRAALLAAGWTHSCSGSWDRPDGYAFGRLEGAYSFMVANRGEK